VALGQAFECGVERCQLAGRELAGQVVELEWVVAQVVELAFAVDVLDVQKVAGAHRLIGRRVSGVVALAVWVAWVVRRPVVLDQCRVLPVRRGPAAQDR
jgi:hypothetical protein